MKGNQEVKWDNNERVIEAVKKTINENGVDITKQLNKHQFYIDNIND